MDYKGKMAAMLRKHGAFNDMESKMMPQTDKSEYGQKLLQHSPITSKVEVQPYGMALKKS